MKKIKFPKHRSKQIPFSIQFASIAICLAAILGCQNNQTNRANKYDQNKTLESRINKVEQQLKSYIKQTPSSNQGSINGSIKTLTFRTGTEDDRLRIYWSDGTKTDLRCEKEQLIWICD